MLLFQHGYLTQSQSQAAELARRLRDSQPEWALRFTLIEADSAAWSGRSDDVLRILGPRLPATANPDSAIHWLARTGWAQAHLHQLAAAEATFAQAGKLCSQAASAACEGLLRAQGGLANEKGDADGAYRFYSQGLDLAHKYGRQLDEATELNNIGYIYLAKEHFDEAIHWLNAARKLATELDAQDLLQQTSGNLAWAYYKLGDSSRALGMYKEAEQNAISLGDTGAAILWVTASGVIYQQEDLARAADAYRTSLQLARQINSKEDIVNALENLAHVSVQAGRLDEAEGYLSQLRPMIEANGNRLDALDEMLAQAGMAAARHDYQSAMTLLHTVDVDPASQTSTRLGAEHGLAQILDQRGDDKAAEAEYRNALTTYESAREQLKQEDSKLPFLANATGIYDDYIALLVREGKTNEALDVADHSRASTLAQGLGLELKQSGFHPAALNPGAISQKAGATLLFYWLGARQSYLWMVTPQKTSLYTLPAQGRIAMLVERYNKALLGPDDPLLVENEAGRELYSMLVAPVAQAIHRDGQVMILADGVLSALNFETLLAPEGKLHYWIDDATVISAPSLSMLAAARPTRGVAPRLLLMGDAISPDKDYPELPYAGREMVQIEKHFSATELSVYAREKATPATYLSSAPANFSYIHFVAHGVASETEPLDSAIILSREAIGGDAKTVDEDGFKLYAREVMQHPITAQLVTISACYGSGTRAYAGEGLVGLSWAFLRAGAHNTIGALWDASDESTPLLMDSLYAGLQRRQSPAVSLRRAKLALLHSEGRFRKPFYWAPFQLYSRL